MHLRLFRSLLATLCFYCALTGNAAPRPIDLNLANQAELEMVKGIGPQLSERLLAERALGRFTNWDDFIVRMKGIGPSHAARLSAAGLRIAGEAYAGVGVQPAK